MNLSKLFETQRVLDARIELEHPQVEGEDRLAKKILALQVELAECANEWRGFKFWSNDQEPRTRMEIECPCCDGTGIIEEEACMTCSGGRIGYENPLLEEYVDCLHFILSIGLELKISYKDYLFEGFQESSIVTHFMEITKHLLGIHRGHEDEWLYMLQQFIGLGEMLGFTWEQIEQAYYDKNAINHTRQNTGY